VIWWEQLRQTGETYWSRFEKKNLLIISKRAKRSTATFSLIQVELAEGLTDFFREQERERQRERERERESER
jgi:hypothetical protein